MPTIFDAFNNFQKNAAGVFQKGGQAIKALRSQPLSFDTDKIVKAAQDTIQTATNSVVNYTRNVVRAAKSIEQPILEGTAGIVQQAQKTIQQAVKDTKTEVRSDTAAIVNAAKNISKIPAQNLKSAGKALAGVGQFGADLGKGLVEQYTKPSEEIKAVEKRLGAGAKNKEIPAVAIKAFARTFGPMLQPFGNDISQILYTHEISDKIISGELPPEVLDEIDVLKKTASQIVGDVSQAVLEAYMPSVFAETAFQFAGQPIKSALIGGAARGGVSALEFGTAQVLSSGSKDPTEIAKTIASNVAVMGILGMVTSGAIPVSKGIVKKAIEIKTEIKAEAIKNGWSPKEAEDIANHGGYMGGIPKKESTTPAQKATLIQEAKTYKIKEGYVQDMLQQDLRKPDLLNEKLKASVEKLNAMPEGKAKVDFANELKKISQQEQPKKLTAEEYGKIWEDANNIKTPITPAQKAVAEGETVFTPSKFAPIKSETSGSTAQTVYVQEKSSGDILRIDFSKSKKTGEITVQKYVRRADGQEILSEGKKLSSLQESFGTQDPELIARGFSTGDTGASQIVSPTTAFNEAKGAIPKANQSVLPGGVKPIIDDGSGIIKERGFYKTVKESTETAPATKEILEDVGGKYPKTGAQYEVITNAQSFAMAEKRVAESLDGAENFILKSFDENNLTAETAQTAHALIRKYGELGQNQKAADLVAVLSDKKTKAGQFIQVPYDLLTPEGVLLFAQKQISKANKARWFPQWTKERKLTSELADDLFNLSKKVQEATGAAKNEAKQELNAALQLLQKPSIARKVSSLQTIAQLLNPKTSIRNIVGNDLLYRFERINKIFVSTPIDVIRSTLTGGERTITFRTAGAQRWGDYFRDLKYGAKAGWKGVNPQGLKTQYDIGKGLAFESKLNPFRYLEKTMGAILKGFDYAAYKRGVREVIGEQASLRVMNDPLAKGLRGTEKIALTQKYMEEVGDNIAKMADEYGKYITFQDDNFISKGLRTIKRGLNLKQEFGAGDMLLKYPSTPGALLARGLEYSPAGFLKSASILFNAVRKGEKIPTRKLTESVSRAITGTLGFTGMGYVLANLGIISSRSETDRDIRGVQETTGQRQYQVNVSALKRFVLGLFNKKEAEWQDGDMVVSYDWAQPIAISISIGADLNRSIKEKETNLMKLKNVSGAAVSSLESGVQSLVEQPLLQGIAKLWGIRKDKAGEQILSIIEETLSDVPASFVPTFSSQIKQITDNTRRSSYSPDFIEESLNKARAKIPFLSTSLNPQYGVFGESKEHFQDDSNTLFNVFLNPAFVNQIKTTPEAKLVLDIYKDIGEKKQAPRVLSLKQKIEGVEIELNNEQYAKMQQFVGKTSQTVFNSLAQNEKFIALSSELQADALSSALTQIGKVAKNTILLKDPEIVRRIVEKKVQDELIKQGYSLEETNKLRENIMQNLNTQQIQENMGITP